LQVNVLPTRDRDSSQLEISEFKRDYHLSKILVYLLCNMLLVHRRSLESFGVHIIIGPLLEVLTWRVPIDLEDVNFSALQKLQYGCIDCLAIILRISLETAVIPMPTISFPDPFSIPFDFSKISFQSMDQLLPLLMDLIRLSTMAESKFECDDKNNNRYGNLDENGAHNKKGAISVSFVTCLFNVLISASKLMSLSALKRYASDIIPLMMKVWSIAKNNAIFRACSLQVIFTVGFHLQSEITMYANDLLEIVQLSLVDQESQVRCAYWAVSSDYSFPNC